MIFDQMLSNFGLTATSRAKLSYQNKLLQPHDKINQSHFKIELWGKNVVTRIDKCHRLFTIPVRAISVFFIIFFARTKCPSKVRIAQAKWSEIVWCLTVISISARVGKSLPPKAALKPMEFCIQNAYYIFT